MKILVTGATGYIGAHLVKALVENGHTVIGTDFNLNQNNISKYTDVVYWDIRQPKIDSFKNIDCVVHLAAQAMVSKSVSDPRLFYQTNIMGTCNVIDSIGSSTDHFLYCSTGGAFKPLANPYFMSKKAAEDIVAKLDNFSLCRFYNVCGNDGFSKFDNSYYHLIRKAAATANGLFPGMKIYGNNYMTPDGTAIRNFSHVTDIVNGLVSLINNGPTNKIECFGNTTGYSVLQVINTIGKLSNKVINAEFAPARPGDSAESIMDIQSIFFNESKTLEDQCLSALIYEK